MQRARAGPWCRCGGSSRGILRRQGACLDHLDHLAAAQVDTPSEAAADIYDDPAMPPADLAGGQLDGLEGRQVTLVELGLHLHDPMANVEGNVRRRLDILLQMPHRNHHCTIEAQITIAPMTTITLTSRAGSRSRQRSSSRPARGVLTLSGPTSLSPAGNWFIGTSFCLRGRCATQGEPSWRRTPPAGSASRGPRRLRSGA